MKDQEIKKTVRDNYAKIVTSGSSCCTPSSSCCGNSSAETISKAIGYTDEELREVPEGSNLGLGCGNPTAIASLKEGEVVLDLGAGAGFDCFLAANRVGEQGRVIGVDMTPEMLDQAKANAAKQNYTNVEFRLGEIEALPVANDTADVAISNCVINLSPDKERVFREIFRALKPGGRIAVSDIVLLKELPEAVRSSASAYVGCIAGALLKGDYLNAIAGAGFEGIEVVDETVFPLDYVTSDSIVKTAAEKLKSEDMQEAATSVVSMKVQAVKPRKS